MAEEYYWDPDTRTYYIHKYYPQRNWESLNDEDLETCHRLLYYKNHSDNKAYGYFTFDLMYALARIVDKSFKRSCIYLTCVPCSDPNKRSTMMKSINMIAKMSEDGTVESFTKCSIPFYDASNLLKRTVPVKAAHKSMERPELKDHIKSISIADIGSDDRKAGYVILDDIVTTGIQMHACNYLLRSNGVEARNIIQLAIGRTFRK